MTDEAAWLRIREACAYARQANSDERAQIMGGRTCLSLFRGPHAHYCYDCPHLPQAGRPLDLGSDGQGAPAEAEPEPEPAVEPEADPNQATEPPESLERVGSDDQETEADNTRDNHGGQGCGLEAETSDRPPQTRKKAAVASKVALNGFVLLHRRLLQHPIWRQLSPSVLKVFIAFLLLANWRPQRWYDGRKEIIIPRGSLGTSYGHISQICGITIKQVRTAFRHLQGAGFAAYLRAGGYTIVTVTNYDAYQPTEDQQGTDEGTAEGIGALLSQSSSRREARAGQGHEVGQQLNKKKNFKKETLGQLPLTDSETPGENPMRMPSVTNPPFDTLDKRRKRRGHDPEIEEWFDKEFWPVYPRKVKKADALKALQRKGVADTEAKRATILAGLKAQLPELQSREWDHIPHPTTWINGEQWENEPPPSTNPGEVDYPVYQPSKVAHA